VKLWVMDSSLFFKLVEGTDAALQPHIAAVFRRADEAGATMAITTITVHEYLVRPRQLGDDEWHRARAVVDDFEVLTFDRAAAEKAAAIERLAPSAGMSKTEAKKIWFRDAAILGTALARGAEVVFTHDGPMANRSVVGLKIERV